MIRPVAAAISFALLGATPALAIAEFPPGFVSREIEVDGATLHVRVGGEGPAVVLLHGFADTGDMWGPLAAALVPGHTVIVPDLRGMGLSSHPEGGYEKVAQATDLVRVLDTLGVSEVALVTHDIGNMVGYAFAAGHRGRVTRWVVMDAPLPGIGHWDEQLRNPLVWHFNFRGKDVERLVAGRERIYLDRFYNELSADPAGIDEATRAHYAALYARPGAMHSAFAQFAAFSQDALDNKALLSHGKLTIPVLAIGGASSYGTKLATEIGFAADHVRAQSIPGAGHWLMEEQPAATVAAVTSFLAEPSDVVLTPDSPRPPPVESVTPVFSSPLPGLTGQVFAAALVSLPPGGRAKPHRHGAAFVYAFVTQGAVRTQLEGAPVETLTAGQGWSEPPGAHHVLTENASPDAPATLLVVFVTPDGNPLKTDDVEGEGK